MDSEFIALETMIAAQETARWTLWMMYATWTAGAATFSAVLVSLYIANMKPKQRIKSTCNTVIVAPLPGVSMFGLSINIANVGIFPVVISSITWVCGGKQKLVMLFNSSASQKLPKKLEYGESAMFFAEINNFSDWKRDILGFIEKSDGSLSKFRYVVTTATGEDITFKISKELLNTLKSDE